MFPYKDADRCSGVFDQVPYNKVTYTIIGDDNAPTYFSIDQRGAVKVRKSLNEDDNEVYKVSGGFTSFRLTP